MQALQKDDPWPELPNTQWSDAYATLHLWSQIVGKICLAAAPWQNHSWHITFHVTARGLSTPLMALGGRDFQFEFDFIDHVLWLRASGGHVRQILLKPMAVAEFHAVLMDELAQLGMAPQISTTPCEIPAPIPFDKDTAHTSYDRDFANIFWRILLRSHEVFSYFRSSFLGKVSPVHFFWGGFDLAVTRFSGRPAPLHPGGIPHLSDGVTREAYSHEVSSAGFWPGSGPVNYPAYYSYAYPQPDGFAAAAVRPAEAFFHAEMGEFILPYESVRRSPNPRAALLAFLQSTYTAAAERGKWNRAELECALGEVGHPREI
ncbi:MAG: DUF5996 family protein [Rhodospirillaceae bacterium]